MSRDTQKLNALFCKMELLPGVDILKAHIALGRDYLRKIIEDMEGMEFNEKHLRKDCDRLRRELDDEMGIMR